MRKPMRREGGISADRFVFASGAAGFEDGTLDFTNIPALELGLSLLQSVRLETVASAFGS